MVVVRTGSRSAAWVLGLLLAGSGCGYEGELPTPSEPSPPPVPPTQAALLLSLSPSPVDAVVAVDGAASWSAEWTLTVQETAGIGGQLGPVSATLTDSAGARFAQTELDGDQLSEQLGGTNRIQGGSRHDIRMSLDFDFPADVLTGDLHVDLQLNDDRGNSVSAAVDDVLQVCVLRLLAPEEGAILDNGCTNRENGILWEFDWSDCADAEAYHFFVQQRNAEEAFVDRRNVTDSSFSVLENGIVFEEARFGWFWRVRARVNGVWSGWSPERVFDVEPVDADCARP